MALIAPARMTVNPSFTSPRFLLNNAVRSGFMRLFPGDGPDVKLTEGAKAVYVPVLDLRTLAKGSQTGYNELPSVSIKANYITTPAYEQKVRVAYSREDLNAASNWNISLASAYTMAMRQAHFQLLRNAALFGFNPQNGEGLINSASGTVRERLQADSNGKTTLDDYDPGQALQAFLRAITGRLNACNLLGISAQYNAGGPLVRVVFLAPQRVLGLLASRIVELTSYQRPGAGSASIIQSIIDVMKASNVDVQFAPNDTLRGRGEGGQDDTNVFGDEFQPDERACNALFVDREVPAEISGPIGAEGTDTVSFMTVTSGWSLRGEATAILSIPVADGNEFSLNTAQAAQATQTASTASSGTAAKTGS
ncbi:major capsid family protein [Bombella apis]|uniref:major capsid family protein n=1 Tax=Bombella apis TaxID=1785988 RepID=UPI0012B755EE|nr:major capsid family protein [Bombella apis]MPW00397.1 DUF2184 domain-containing protein [Bombella apis]